MNNNTISTALLLLLITSLFLGRAFLSITTVIFSLAQVGLHYKMYTKEVLKKAYPLLGFSIIFFIALLTFFYSTNITEWSNRTVVKLPLVLLPVAFISLKPNRVLVTLVNTLFILFVIGGTIFSLSYYWLYTDIYESGYQFAKVLPTLLDNDHIRFSWCVVIALVLLLYQYNFTQNKKLRIANTIMAVWLFIYLHILSSKTGLLFCYVAIGSYLCYQIIYKRKGKLVWLILIVAALPIAAYYTVPTFKKRMDYIRYDFSFYSKGNYKTGLSDGARVASVKAGVATMQQNWLVGVGYGDVQEEVNKWYEKNTSFLDYEKILPSSQLIIILTASGIIGCILFLVGLLLPLIVKTYRQNVYFLLFYSTALLGLLFEIPLEGQYGVFIFAFFASWFMYLANNKVVYD